MDEGKNLIYLSLIGYFYKPELFKLFFLCFQVRGLVSDLGSDPFSVVITFFIEYLICIHIHQKGSRVPFSLVGYVKFILLQSTAKNLEVGVVLACRQLVYMQQFPSHNTPTQKLVLAIESNELILDNFSGQIGIPFAHADKCNGVSMESGHYVKAVKGPHKGKARVVLVPVNYPIKADLDIFQHITGISVLCDHVIDVVESKS